MFMLKFQVYKKLKGILRKLEAKKGDCEHSNYGAKTASWKHPDDTEEPQVKPSAYVQFQASLRLLLAAPGRSQKSKSSRTNTSVSITD